MAVAEAPDFIADPVAKSPDFIPDAPRVSSTPDFIPDAAPKTPDFIPDKATAASPSADFNSSPQRAALERETTAIAESGDDPGTKNLHVMMARAKYGQQGPVSIPSAHDVSTPITNPLHRAAVDVMGPIAETPTKMASLVAPQTFNPMTQQIEDESRVPGNAADTATRAVAGVVPYLALPGGAAGKVAGAVIGGITGAGGVRGEIAQRRQQGQQISGGQELAAATGQGAIDATMAVAGLGAGEKTAAAVGGGLLRRAAVAAPVTAAEMLPVAEGANAASNALAAKTYDPGRPVLQGAGPTAIGALATGAAFGLHGAVSSPGAAAQADIPGYIHPSEIPDGAKIVGTTTMNGQAAETVQMPDGSIRHTDQLRNAETPAPTPEPPPQAPAPMAESRENIPNPIPPGESRPPQGRESASPPPAVGGAVEPEKTTAPASSPQLPPGESGIAQPSSPTPSGQGAGGARQVSPSPEPTPPPPAGQPFVPPEARPASVAGEGSGKSIAYEAGQKYAADSNLNWRDNSASKKARNKALADSGISNIQPPHTEDFNRGVHDHLMQSDPWYMADRSDDATLKAIAQAAHSDARAEDTPEVISRRLPDIAREQHLDLEDTDDLKQAAKIAVSDMVEEGESARADAAEKEDKRIDRFPIEERFKQGVDRPEDRRDLLVKELDRLGVPQFASSYGSTYLGDRDDFKIRISDHDARPTYERLNGAADVEVNWGDAGKRNTSTHDISRGSLADIKSVAASIAREYHEKTAKSLPGGGSEQGKSAGGAEPAKEDLGLSGGRNAGAIVPPTAAEVGGAWNRFKAALTLRPRFRATELRYGSAVAQPLTEQANATQAAKSGESFFFNRAFGKAADPEQAYKDWWELGQHFRVELEKARGGTPTGVATLSPAEVARRMADPTIKNAINLWNKEFSPEINRIRNRNGMVMDPNASKVPFFLNMPTESGPYTPGPNTTAYTKSFNKRFTGLGQYESDPHEGVSRIIRGHLKTDAAARVGDQVNVMHTELETAHGLPALEKAYDDKEPVDFRGRSTKLGVVDLNEGKSANGKALPPDFKFVPSDLAHQINDVHQDRGTLPDIISMAQRVATWPITQFSSLPHYMRVVHNVGRAIAGNLPSAAENIQSALPSWLGSARMARGEMLKMKGSDVGRMGQILVDASGSDRGTAWGQDAKSALGKKLNATHEMLFNPETGVDPMMRRVLANHYSRLQMGAKDFDAIRNDVQSGKVSAQDGANQIKAAIGDKGVQEVGRNVNKRLGFMNPQTRTQFLNILNHFFPFVGSESGSIPSEVKDAVMRNVKPGQLVNQARKGNYATAIGQGAAMLGAGTIGTALLKEGVNWLSNLAFKGKGKPMADNDPGHKDDAEIYPGVYLHGPDPGDVRGRALGGQTDAANKKDFHPGINSANEVGTTLHPAIRGLFTALTGRELHLGDKGNLFPNRGGLLGGIAQWLPLRSTAQSLETGKSVGEGLTEDATSMAGEPVRFGDLHQQKPENPFHDENVAARAASKSGQKYERSDAYKTYEKQQRADGKAKKAG